MSLERLLAKTLLDLNLIHYCLSCTTDCQIWSAVVGCRDEAPRLHPSTFHARQFCIASDINININIAYSHGTITPEAATCRWRGDNLSHSPYPPGDLEQAEADELSHAYYELAAPTAVRMV